MSTAFIVSTTDAADELKTAIVVEGGDFWEVHSTDFEGEVTTSIKPGRWFAPVSCVRFGRPVVSWKLPSFADARLLHRDAVAHILQNGGYNPQ